MTDIEKPRENEIPVRGSLRLTVNTSSPKITAGSDFSIFVVIQNPFDVPITIYQVQTHIPIELVDVNGIRLDLARREGQYTGMRRPIYKKLYEDWRYRLESKRKHTGIAVAVGTDFDPAVERELFNVSTTVQTMGEGSSVVGVQFKFPVNPTAEELDMIFRRVTDYQKGLIPVTLQPGDSVVKQFVLRTRSWLFFTPLVHRFQIQVNFASDGVDHTDTIAYEQSIQSTIAAMVIGAGLGAMVGTFLKSLSTTTTAGEQGGSILRALLASVLASIAVVVAFARKSTAQPLVSVEDFWGGTMIGFSVGFFGFEQFYGLFSSSS